MEIKKINAYAAHAPQKAQEPAQRPTGEEKTIPNQESTVEPDRVEWSRGYQEMAQVKRVMMDRSELRTEQVDQIRNMVKDGSYIIDPEKIAERMLEEIL